MESAAIGLFRLLPQWYLKTIMIMEPIAISFFRSLPNAHPLYRLLQPFLHDAVASAAATREWFAGDGGFWDRYCSVSLEALEDILRHFYKGFVFEKNAPTAILKVTSVSFFQARVPCVSLSSCPPFFLLPLLCPLSSFWCPLPVALQCLPLCHRTAFLGAHLLPWNQTSSRAATTPGHARPRAYASNVGVPLCPAGVWNRGCVIPVPVPRGLARSVGVHQGPGGRVPRGECAPLVLLLLTFCPGACPALETRRERKKSPSQHLLLRLPGSTFCCHNQLCTRQVTRNWAADEKPVNLD